MNNRDRRTRRGDQHRRPGKPPKSAKPAPPPLRRRVRAARVPSALPTPQPPKWLLSDQDTLISTGPVKELLDTLQIPYTEEQLAKLVDHLLLVRQYNREVNLVSRSDVERVLLKSLWESVVAVRDTTLPKEGQLLDLGTGGGFPGLSLAILWPGVHVTLLDSRRAKTLVLRKMIDELGLENLEVVHDRAETFQEHSEVSFDLITVRAVSVLPEIASWIDGLRHSGQLLLAWKGPEGVQEIASLPEDQWKLEHTLRVPPHRYVFVLKAL